MAVTLLGLPLSTSYDPVRERWHTSILKSSFVGPVRASRFPRVSDQAMTIETVQSDAVLWCPATKNRNWLARRNGSVYFTGNTSDPSEILVFAEEPGKVSKLRLISRLTLERINHENQVKAILFLLGFYRPKCFAMDKTGLGLPLFQDVQNQARVDKNLKALQDRIKGYNFSEKILVGYDESIEVDEFLGDPEHEAGIRRQVLEYSTDQLRSLVDAQRLLLPFDKELIAEFQGQTFTYNKGKMDLYGRARNFSKGGFHALDAARMAVTGWSQYSIESINKEKDKFVPVAAVFL
jgi:hypothetical protein